MLKIKGPKKPRKAEIVTLESDINNFLNGFNVDLTFICE